MFEPHEMRFAVQGNRQGAGFRACRDTIEGHLGIWRMNIDEQDVGALLIDP